MTKLEFNYQDLEIDNLPEVDDKDLQAILSETCFFVPSRLLINGINVFEYRSTKAMKVEWIQIPAFNILLYWKAALMLLPIKRKIDLIIPSGLVEIALENNDVRLRSNFSPNTATEPYEEFMKGMQRGMADLREVLNDRIPDSSKRILIRANAFGS